MSLLCKEKALIKKDYFQVWEVVEMLREYSNGSWEDVGEFLGHYNFDTELGSVENYRELIKLAHN